MRSLLATLSLAGTLLLLAGCAGAGRGVLHPPQIRLQEVAVADDGGLALALRAMNNAGRSARFERLELTLALGDAAPLSLREMGARELPPRSVEIYRFALRPAEAGDPLVLDERAALFWRLEGRIVVEGQSFPLEAEGRLDPVPGRPGLFR